MVGRPRLEGKMASVIGSTCALITAFCIANGALLQDERGNAPSTGVADKGGLHEKWVVITTISYPMDAVKKLAAMPGWRLVVVADLKTPQDWHLEGADFLSIELQKTLKYSILEHLPNNHYGRKNVGYLWAIEHGATEIYETDDDNLLLSDMVPTFESLQYFVYNRSSAAINVYPHFGEKDMWPRGFPLDHVHKQNNSNHFIRTEAKPLVLQGLANVDPDVDAIYRLTLPLGITFDKDAFAVALPSGAFCPFNSQNTLFARDALWGLLIPVTTTFRVCDIWRGYWVQRMLWQVGGHLAFQTATVDQHRNPHRLLLDFADELDLYSQAGELVQYLLDWRPLAQIFEDQLTELATNMAEKGFWKTGDAQLMKAWVHDLKSIGYKFPVLKEEAVTAPLAIIPSSMASVQTAPAWARQYDINLVINCDSPNLESLMALRSLRKAYFPIFQQVIFTGAQKPANIPDEFHWVGCNSEEGSYQYSCLANVMEQVPVAPTGGYLFLNDDVLFSHCQLPSFNRSRIWFHSNMVTALSRAEKHSGHHSPQHTTVNAKVGKNENTSGQALTQVLKSFLPSGVHANHFADAASQLLLHLDQKAIEEEWAHGFYIPQRLATDYVYGVAVLRQANIPHGVAIPTLLGLLSREPFEVFKETYLIEHEKRAMRSLLPTGQLSDNTFLLHPFDLSWPGAAEAFDEWWYNGSLSHACHHASSEWEWKKTGS